MTIRGWGGDLLVRQGGRDINILRVRGGE